MVPTQGLQGIAFFEATACLTLLVLFIHLRRDNTGISYRLWLLGWFGLTISSFCELAMFYRQQASLRVVVSAFGVGALVMFLASIVQSRTVQNRLYWPMPWVAGLMALAASYYESRAPGWDEAPWQSSILVSAICLASAWLLWRASNSRPGWHGIPMVSAW